MNPLITSREVFTTYFRYILTRFPLGKTNPIYLEQFKSLLNSADAKDKLIKGPYLELIPPYKTSESLNQLNELDNRWQPLVDQLLTKDSELVNRPLYLHQTTALVQSFNNNLVIASGTGSGKTECFLYPIIRYCLENQGIGVRAILIYPLNSLVEDQIFRLNNLLCGSHVTFGRYTGLTPKTGDIEKKLSENHLVNRKEMRESPPNILITNYAMLEYMILRPGDSPLFDKRDKASFKYFVLDEAHTYNGAQGAEVAFLLKRLKQKVNKSENEMTCFATSATLGSGKDTAIKTSNFASKLFGVPFTEQSIIQGFRQNILEDVPTQSSNSYKMEHVLSIDYPYDEISSSDVEKYFHINLGNSEPKYELYNHLKFNEQVNIILRILEKEPTSIQNLAKAVFPSKSSDYSEEATIKLLAWADWVQKNNKTHVSLLPTRYHFFVSATKGLYCSLSKDKNECWDILALSANSIQKTSDRPYPFEIAVCKVCGEPYLVGVLHNDKNGNCFYKPIAESFFETLETENEFNQKVILSFKELKDSNSKTNVCRLCGSINCDCGHKDSDKRIMYSIDALNIKNDQEFEELASEDMDVKNGGCVKCGYGNKIEDAIFPLRFANNGTMAPIVSTLYNQCSPMDEKSKGIVEAELTNIYGEFNTNWTPIVGDGRKLIIFSDSRQEAAYFGPYLQVSHMAWVFSTFAKNLLLERQATAIEEWIDIIVRKLNALKDGKLNCSLLLKDIRPHIDKKPENCLADEFIKYGKITDRAYQCIFSLIGRDASLLTGIEGVGIGAIFLKDNVYKIADSINIDGITNNNKLGLVQILVRHLRFFEIFDLTLSDGTQIDRDSYFGQRYDKILYTEEKLTRKQKNPKGSVRVISVNKTENKFQVFIKHVLSKFKNTTPEKINSNEINDLIKKLIHILIKAGVLNHSRNNGYKININKLHIVLHDDSSQSFKENIPGGLSTFKVCSRCGRLSWIDIGGLCNYPGCYGQLISSENSLQLSKLNHFRNWFIDDQKPGLRIVEHTAQLEKTTAASTYQDEFKRGRLNVLSCSTTFEMGVDLGDLGIVVMKNVPPNISNYIQRAGRAGRRPGLSPFVLTYCRSLPHDQYYYKNCLKLVRGEVNPPVLVLENKKIIQRHFNAIVISDFLKEYQDIFSDPHKSYKSDPIISTFFEESDLFNSVSPAEYLCNEYIFRNKEELKNKFINISGSKISKDTLDSVLENYFTNFGNDAKYGLLKRIRGNYIDATNFYKSEMGKLDPKIEKEQKYFNQFMSRLKQLRSEQLIKYLSSRGFLPSYAFPTNVVPLEIWADGKKSDYLDLNRELGRAISEYAPGASIVANSKVYTSGALNKYPKQTFDTFYYRSCPKCQWFTFHMDRDVINKISKCQAEGCNEIFNCSPNCAIYPQWGFSVPRDNKPQWISKTTRLTKSGYASELYIDEKGFDPIKPVSVKLNDNVEIRLDFKGGYDLVKVNKGIFDEKSEKSLGFNICEKCGMEIDEPGQHISPFGNKCDGSILNKQHLISIFDTDVLRITFSKSPSLPLSSLNSPYRWRSFWRSVMYAILESMSRVLEIPRNDLDSIYIPHKNRFAKLIYLDNVPGGAGHVMRLLGKGGESPKTLLIEILNEAINILNCTECSTDTACYACLFHHGNQKVQHTLNRGLALEWLAKF